MHRHRVDFAFLRSSATMSLGQAWTNRLILWVLLSYCLLLHMQYIFVHCYDRLVQAESLILILLTVDSTLSCGLQIREGNLTNPPVIG